LCTESGDIKSKIEPYLRVVMLTGPPSTSHVMSCHVVVCDSAIDWHQRLSEQQIMHKFRGWDADGAGFDPWDGSIDFGAVQRCAGADVAALDACSLGKLMCANERLV
jgi:hypothetical protein